MLNRTTDVPAMHDVQKKSSIRVTSYCLLKKTHHMLILMLLSLQSFLNATETLSSIGKKKDSMLLPFPLCMFQFLDIPHKGLLMHQPRKFTPIQHTQIPQSQFRKQLVD